jgi:hypothetical protein
VRWVVVWLACLVALGQVEVRLEVRDEAGQPIAEAYAYAETLPRSFASSDRDGRVKFSTKRSAIVIRKEGYESVFLKVGEGGDVPVRMKRIGDLPEVRNCGKSEKHIGKLADPYFFSFPQLEEIVASKSRSDTDYVYRSYRIRKRKPLAQIVHGKGYAYSLGFPSEMDVNESVTYFERQFQLGPQRLMDARGVDVRGRRWRYVGWLGEAAAYHGVDGEAAAVLDRVLDGVCVGSGF